MTEQQFKDINGFFEDNPKTGLKIHALLGGGWCIEDSYARSGDNLCCKGSFEKCYEYYTTQKSIHIA